MADWEQTQAIGGCKFTTVAVRYRIRGYVQYRTYCYVDGVKVSREQFHQERRRARIRERVTRGLEVAA